MIRTGVVIAASVLAMSLSASEIPPDSGVPVHVLVTVQQHANTPTTPITTDDVLVSQNRQHRTVTGVAPLTSASGLQLWILIDDGSITNLSTQFNDLRQFILAQPSTVQIGIGYLRNGFVEQVQPLTSDHALAAKAIRLPIGPPGISACPYSALEDLIKKWPAGAGAREVLMVSSGIDPEYGGGPQDPYLDASIHSAQRAGVVVYSIYYPGSGFIGRSGWQVFWGQNYLSQLSDDTGGQMYWIGNIPPVSLTPYLDDLTRRLNGQYLVTFLAKPESKAGLQRVDIKVETPHVNVTAPSQVYVPAGR